MSQRDFTPHQQKIIQRFYENRDQRDDQRLSELATELYLASDKKKPKLWQAAREIMVRLGVPASRVEHVVTSADPAILAEVVKDLQAGKIVKPAKKPGTGDGTAR